MLEYSKGEFMNNNDVVDKKFNLSQVSVPTEYAMFSKVGDRSLELKGQTLIKNLSKIKVSSPDRNVESVKAFTKYFKSWKSCSKSKSMKEYSDSAVRELILQFAKDCARIVDIPEDMVYKMYETAYWGK